MAEIKIGRSHIHRDHLDSLTDAWRKNRLVLFLGAGISTEFGIPLLFIRHAASGAVRLR